MNLHRSFILAILLGLLSIVAWEMYWRSQGRIPNIDDSNSLSSIQRAKLENPTDDQVVFIGSSRILFDIQLDLWREQTGTDPVMLAFQGASPLPTLRDIVDNTDFKGTLIVGVTEGLFFSTTFPKAPPISRAQERLDHYYDRTYAQRLNHHLSVPLQKNLAFVTVADEFWDSDVDLGTLLWGQVSDERAGPKPAPFYQFEDVSLDRNVQMTSRTTNDTAYANTIKLAWQDMLSGDMPPPDKEGTTKFFLEYAEKFLEKGGNMILVRCPSDGWFKEIETMGLPREEYWDSLVIKSKLPSYHYADYEQFQDLNLPEWSHLSKEDADYFTTEIIKIFKKDGVLTNSKTE
ncbi:MAG: hypothetical protein KJO05_04550 [Bacteroidia bacterium]|nr:hypothetical protein [Bacteroidia bacterium]NNF30707.1 hypothetical protein [Flavobacteriaceae bacterium]MBT8277248.1 hypothetical protein [Bacteroidia bacterium]NNJ80773.1 hypothetical protein [Flavobacteriaceae bacterium]NNK54848.1 hypothetical protein [Flavobacteriaceae bacterium]